MLEREMVFFFFLLMNVGTVYCTSANDNCGLLLVTKYASVTCASLISLETEVSEPNTFIQDRIIIAGIREPFRLMFYSVQS